MKTSKMNLTELSQEEMQKTEGGFLFLLIPALIANAAIVATLVAPVAAAAVKGWNDAG